MPFRRNYRRRFRPRRTNRYAKLNRFGHNAGYSRFRKSQSQTYKSFWFTQNGSLTAAESNGILSRRWTAADVINSNQFLSCAFIFEQYRVMKIIVNLIPSANMSTGQYNRFHRGNIVTMIDPPPYRSNVINGISSLMENSSTKMHDSSRRIKRYIFRPKEQYNKWALIPRIATTPPGPVPYPQPSIDEWQTRILVYGENFNQPYIDDQIPPVIHPVPASIDNIYYFFTAKFFVQFKSRVDQG